MAEREQFLCPANGSTFVEQLNWLGNMAAHDDYNHFFLQTYN